MSLLQIRTIQSHDIEDNWNSLPDFVPACGEIIFYDKDDSHTYVRYKVGDGVSSLRQLEFLMSIPAEGTIVMDAGRIPAVAEG